MAEQNKVVAATTTATTATITTAITKATATATAPRAPAPLQPGPQESTAVAPATPTKPEGKGTKRAPPVTQSTKKTPSAKKARKKREDAKSTTTTTTLTANKPVNVYDSVLGEAEDLLKAAMEAQALGRLKMASAYQLLLHARLVGLGKRFDRARVIHTDESTAGNGTASTSSSASPAAASTKSSDGSPIASAKTSAEKTNTPDSKQDADPAAELAKVLPTGIELDQGMMEHLARAAMELHHKRTGRRIQSDTPPKATGTTKSAAAAGTTGVAWTEEELIKFQQVVKKGKKEPADIAKAMGTRTEAQVRAYLRNTQERQKGARAVEQEWGEAAGGSENDKGGDGGAVGEEISPRKHGGRGRKPPTTAMNTVPNAKLDARSLLSGNAL